MSKRYNWLVLLICFFIYSTSLNLFAEEESPSSRRFFILQEENYEADEKTEERSEQIEGKAGEDQTIDTGEEKETDAGKDKVKSEEKDETSKDTSDDKIENKADKTADKKKDDDGVNFLREIIFVDKGENPGIKLSADKAVEDITSFKLNKPLRLVFDLKGLKADLKKEKALKAYGPIIRLRYFSHKDRLRLVLDMQEDWDGEYRTEKIDSGLLIKLKGKKDEVIDEVKLETSDELKEEKIEETDIEKEDPAEAIIKDKEPEQKTEEEKLVQEKAEKIQEEIVKLAERGLWLKPYELLLEIGKMEEEGRAALPAIRYILEKEDNPYPQYRFTQKAAIEALAAIKIKDREEAERLLLPYLEKHHFALRQSAAKALGEIGVKSEKSFKALCKTAGKDISSPVKKEALIALGLTGGNFKAESFEVMEKASRDKAHQVRFEAIRLLSEISEKAEARSILKKACDDPNKDIREFARSSLEDKS